MNDIEKKYWELANKNIRQRKKGLPNDKLVSPGLIISSIVCLFVVPFGDIFFGYRNLAAENLPYLALFYFGLILFSVLVPQLISDDVKRSVWKTRRKYPNVHNSIFLYEYHLINEKMRNGLNPLIVDGTTYFLGAYTRFNTQKSQMEMIGYALFDDKNKNIDDIEIFKKAFFTYNYGLIGSITGQKSSGVDYLYFKEMKKVYLPRIRKYLNRKNKYFSQIGQANQYEQLMEKIYICEDVGKEILHFLAIREKFRISMGYSFAYEHYYEDALSEYELREAFYDYVKSKYFDDIDVIKNYSDELLNVLKTKRGLFSHKLLQLRIVRIYNYSVRVINFLNKMKYQGIPDVDDFRLFNLKLEYIKNYKIKKQGRMK